MRQHSRLEKGLENFLLCGVIPVVASAHILEPINCQSLLILVEKMGPRRIVGQDPNRGQNAQHGNDAFDDEQPAETLQASSAIDVTNAIGDRATECTS